MGKYASHEDLGANAPPEYRDKTTQQVYRTPRGMRPKETRCRRFEERTDFDASVRWHHNYDMAMFGGSDIERPTSESKQRALEMEFRRR
jgi:hypothetical protein